MVLAYFLELIKNHPGLVPLIRVDARVGRRQSSSAAGSLKRASDPPSWAPPNPDGDSGGTGVLPAEPHNGGDSMAPDTTGGPLFTTGWPSTAGVEDAAAAAATSATPAAASAPHHPPTSPPSAAGNGVGALALPLVSAGPAGPAPSFPASDTDAAAVAAATAAATATLRASTGGGAADLGKRAAPAGDGGGAYEEPPPKRHDSSGGGGADHTAADLAAIASAYRSAKEAQAPLSIILMLEEKLREAACNVTTSR